MARGTLVITDPHHPPPELYHIADIRRPPPLYASQQSGTLSFFAKDGILIILSHGPYLNPLTNERKYLFAQMEFPVGVARWLVEQIGPVAGESLFVGDVSIAKKAIAGERMILTHSSCGGGSNRPGWVLGNADRYDEEMGSTHRINLSDEFLFKYGLYDLWKQIAERHERGEF